MNLIPNWKEIAVKAWSMRLWAVAFVLQAVELLFQLFAEGKLPKGVFAILSLCFMAGGMYARLVLQPKLVQK